MKYEIKHRFSGAVLFALETESMKLCVEAAVSSGSDLSWSDLSGSNLSGSDLSWSNLRGSNLSGSDLSWSDLRGSNLRGSDLSGSNLRGSNLSGSDLSWSDLRGSNLRGSDLSGSNLSGSNLSGSDLSWSDLRGSNLSWSDLRGSNLRGSDLSGSDGKKLTLIDSRPLLQLGPLGSRADYLSAWLTDAGIYVRAGCFWDTLAKFKAAVKETHGTTTIHAKDYAAAIKFIEVHARLWKPKKEKTT